MLVLGVTGGIGAGKSTVAAKLAERGARVLDADRIVRELYRGGAIPDRIAARFGAGVRASDGSIDRAALAAAVFEDPVARKDLEAIVHPGVRERVERQLRDWRAEGFRGIAVIDAALLVESTYEYPLDALLVVVASEPRRLARLEARGMPEEEARRRMAAQAPDERKRARADFVVENDGSLDDLDRALDAVLAELGRDAAT
jgi:dephospho-CoA kinase